MSLSKAKKNHALGPHASTSMEAAINVLPMSGRDRAIAIPASPPVRVPQSDPVHTALILLWTHFGIRLCSWVARNAVGTPYWQIPDTVALGEAR